MSQQYPEPKLHVSKNLKLCDLEVGHIGPFLKVGVTSTKEYIFYCQACGLKFNNQTKYPRAMPPITRF